MTAALPMFEPNVAVFGVPEVEEDSNDPRVVYPELSQEAAWRGWPCAECQARLDEHADQDVASRFPELDITDHQFVPALDEGASFFRARRVLPATGGIVPSGTIETAMLGNDGPEYIVPLPKVDES